jgi:hypothetical protein
MTTVDVLGSDDDCYDVERLQPHRRGRDQAADLWRARSTRITTVEVGQETDSRRRPGHEGGRTFRSGLIRSFVWSGRRDSNPRPSPWQRHRHLPASTFQHARDRPRQADLPSSPAGSLRADSRAVYYGWPTIVGQRNQAELRSTPCQATRRSPTSTRSGPSTGSTPTSRRSPVGMVRSKLVARSSAEHQQSATPTVPGIDSILSNGARLPSAKPAISRRANAYSAPSTTSTPTAQPVQRVEDEWPEFWEQVEQAVVSAGSSLDAYRTDEHPHFLRVFSLD